MLSRRAAFSLLGALALSVSLGLKLLALDVARPDVMAYNRALAARLAAQGFATAIEDRTDDLDFVVARRGNCMLKARTEETADRKLSFRQFTKGLPVVRYRYRGTYRPAFPKLDFTLRYLVERAALRLRLAGGVERPLAIAASRGCNLSEVDFGPQIIPARRIGAR